VLVSLLGLRLAGLQTYASFGFATALAVLAVACAALTLVPAALGLAGRRVLPRSVRRGRPARTGEPLTARWAARVGNRPLPWAVGALALLSVLAVPALDMRMWPADTGAQPEGTTTREAYDLVAQEFGPGANGPFVLAVDLAEVDAATLPALADELAAVPGVAGVVGPQVSPSGGAATLVLEPTTAPSDVRTTELLHVLRDDVLPAGVEVTGITPALADITACWRSGCRW
jgi:RND superfamily putative drug exporter